jgi:hypothetical protein
MLVLLVIGYFISFCFYCLCLYCSPCLVSLLLLSLFVSLCLFGAFFGRWALLSYLWSIFVFIFVFVLFGRFILSLCLVVFLSLFFFLSSLSRFSFCLLFSGSRRPVFIAHFVCFNLLSLFSCLLLVFVVLCLSYSWGFVSVLSTCFCGCLLYFVFESFCLVVYDFVLNLSLLCPFVCLRYLFVCLLSLLFVYLCSLCCFFLFLALLFVSLFSRALVRPVFRAFVRLVLVSSLFVFFFRFFSVFVKLFVFLFLCCCFVC